MNNYKNLNIKNDFEILKKRKNLVYLNSSSTSLKPNLVIDELSNIYKENITTLNKSLSEERSLEKRFFNSLEKVSNFINAEKGSVIPTPGTTDSINKIASNIIDTLKDGDEIILGEFEHASNILPWINISKLRKKNIVIKWYSIKNFSIDLDDLKKITNKKTKVISLTHCFNTFGTKNNISAIRDIVGKDVKIVVDAAQSIGHMKINVKEMDCDFLIFGAHKAFGPHGLGFTYIKNISDFDSPFIYGGGMNKNYDKNSILLKDDITKFLGGTQNVPGVIAFGESIDYMNKFGIDNIELYNNELKEYAEKKLSDVPNIRIINKGSQSHNLFFEIKGVAAEDVAYHLLLDNIIVRPGSSCVKIKNKIYQQHKSIRASFHIYNDKDDIDKLYDSLIKGGDFLDYFFRKKSSSSTCL